jgi:hypothetical protein
MVLQVYEKVQVSVAEHRAGKHQNTHGLPMKAILFQSKVMMDMPGRQIKITQARRPFRNTSFITHQGQSYNQKAD